MRTRAVSAAFGAKIGQNIGNGSKKGGKHFVAQKMMYMYAEFNLDYDFAIKHDLII